MKKQLMMVLFAAMATFSFAQSNKEDIDLAQASIGKDKKVLYAQFMILDAAHKDAAEVLRLKPNFALMDELELWNVPKAYADQIAEGAKKAGIPANGGDKGR